MLDVRFGPQWLRKPNNSRLTGQLRAQSALSGVKSVIPSVHGEGRSAREDFEPPSDPKENRRFVLRPVQRPGGSLRSRTPPMLPEEPKFVLRRAVHHVSKATAARNIAYHLTRTLVRRVNGGSPLRQNFVSLWLLRSCQTYHQSSQHFHREILHQRLSLSRRRTAPS